MSRVKRFAHSLVSGYAVVGSNIVYTLASVPLALHYLSKGEIGLWALVMQVAGYLQLIDLGMAGSISRILIDHKDRPGDGVYGAIIKTGALVLVVQGAIIAAGGALLSLCLPGLLGVPSDFRHEFQVLIAGQCLVMGLTFVGRMSGHVLSAHQRYDAVNYAQVGMLFAGLGVLWLGFSLGWGLYSQLAGYVASTIFGTVFPFLAVVRLKLFPQPGAWGRANRKTFTELFAYGREIFMLTVGWQLVNASQIVVISRTLGLDAAAVWSIATKPFALVQQVVFRLLDFSAGGLAEMMVRQERDRLLPRFRDLVVLSASLAAWIGLAMGLCNHELLAVWTKGRVSWGISSDWLMALLVVVYSTTRCFIGFTGLTKEIRRMQYIYFLEGLVFVCVGIAAVRAWGFNGLIGSALVTNSIFSGVYGFRRAQQYFGNIQTRVLLGWFKRPLWCLLSLAAAFGTLAWAGQHWDFGIGDSDAQAAARNSLIRLIIYAATAGLLGFGLFCRIGLSPQLRGEAAKLVSQLRNRLRFRLSPRP